MPLEETDGLHLGDPITARKEDASIVRVSDTVVAAVVGGVNRVLISHVLSGDPAPLTKLKPELLRFIKLTLASHEES